MPLVAVLLAGGVAAFVLLRSDAPETTRAILAESRLASERPLRSFNEADTLGELRATKPALKRAALELATISTRTKEIDSSDYRAAAAGLVAAQSQVIAQFIALSGLRASTLDTFSHINASAVASVEQLSAASRRVAALDLPYTSVLARPELFTAALQDLRPLIRTANRRLAKWRSEYRRLRAEQRSDLAVLDSYRATMEGHLAKYNELRTAMQEWVDGIDSGTTFSEAYEFLGEAASERAALRDALKLQSPPGGIGPTHGQLMMVITDAVEAVDAAYSGLGDYEYNREDYDTYSDAPGWQEFLSSSASLSNRYSGAVQSWRVALDKEQKRIKSRNLPRPPEV